MRSRRRRRIPAVGTRIVQPGLCVRRGNNNVSDRFSNVAPDPRTKIRASRLLARLLRDSLGRSRRFYATLKKKNVVFDIRLRPNVNVWPPTPITTHDVLIPSAVYAQCHVGKGAHCGWGLRGHDPSLEMSSFNNSAEKLI